jgi:N-ethylmaleimide reductase
MRKQPRLFMLVKVGALELPNRIVMSPMTRIQAGEGCVPSERMFTSSGRPWRKER